MNDTTVRPFMYEQVSRDCFIRFICSCGLAASLKFNSVHWQSLLWLSMESISILIFIFHLQSTLSSTQNYVILYCRCQSFSLLLSTDFSPNCRFHLLWKLFFLQACGYYLLILWILKCLVATWEVVRIQVVSSQLL